MLSLPRVTAFTPDLDFRRLCADLTVIRNAERHCYQSLTSGIYFRGFYITDVNESGHISVTNICFGSTDSIHVMSHTYSARVAGRVCVPELKFGIC